MRTTPPRTVSANVLRKYRQAGFDSPVLDARLRFMDAEGLARYARAIEGHDRIYPHAHPLAQASGRCSTTDPALVNFPARESCRKCGHLKEAHVSTSRSCSCCQSTEYEVGNTVAWGMILPDDGWYFLHYDMVALHARIAAAYTKDQDDLACFANGWDLHTMTACRMWNWEFCPPDTVASPTDPPWQGHSDRRRRLAKVIRYALLLGLSEKSALESKDIEKEGLTADEILGFARLYLRSKPGTVAAKKRIWDQCIRNGKSRSFGGRLRRLTFDPRNKTNVEDAMKEGWSHILQGGEQDIMTTIMASIWAEIPEALLVLNSHDGHTWTFPQYKYPPQETLNQIRPLVERTWEIAGEQVPIPADWEILYPDESVVRVGAST